jgi:CO/xanthine dehydrogenase FAD-binding subunit
VKPPPFAYARPESLEEALTLLAEAGSEAKLLAGGQSLVPALAYRLARPSHLVDIDRLPGLDRVGLEDGALVLGPLVRHATLERARLGGAWALLAEAAAHIGHLPIRLRGTIGGSLAHADPAAELPAALLALDAELVLRSLRGARRLPAAEFFAGPFTTALAADEAIVEVRLPPPPGVARGAFEELAPRAGDFALAAVAAAAAVDGAGRVLWTRIALAAVGATPLRAPGAEAALAGAGLGEEGIAAAAAAAAAECEPALEAGYRRELVAVLVERALRRIRREA